MAAMSTGGWHPPAAEGGWAPPNPQPQGWGAPQPGWGAPLPPENKPGIIPLRPLAVGELLDGAFATIRRHPRVTLGLAALIATAQALLSVVVPGLLGAATTPLADTGAAGSETGLQVFQLISQGVGAVVGALLGTLFAGMIIVVVSEAVLGREVPAGAVWARVRPRFWALIGVALLAGLGPYLLAAAVIALAILLIALGGGVAALIAVPMVIGAVIGAVYLRNLWSLSAPALVLESTRPVAALRRSRTLVRGSWWRLFWLRLLAGLIASAVSGVIALPFALVGVAVNGGDVGADGTTPVSFVALYALGAALAATITLPFSSGVQALLYVDRRIRAEALDVKLAEAAAPSL